MRPIGLIASRVAHRSDISVCLLVTGAKTFQQMDEGAEIDWVALAKGRHQYKEKVKRGEVSTL